MEESWPYFNNALALSGPIGNPFFTKSEAKRFYSKISSCLDCEYSDLECLRSKTLQEITDCSWGSNILTEDGPSYICKYYLLNQTRPKLDRDQTRIKPGPDPGQTRTRPRPDPDQTKLNLKRSKMEK